MIYLIFILKNSFDTYFKICDLYMSLKKREFILYINILKILIFPRDITIRSSGIFFLTNCQFSRGGTTPPGDGTGGGQKRGPIPMTDRALPINASQLFSSS